jgi:hypothetical protein
MHDRRIPSAFAVAAAREVLSRIINDTTFAITDDERLEAYPESCSRKTHQPRIWKSCSP